MPGKDAEVKAIPDDGNVLRRVAPMMVVNDPKHPSGRRPSQAVFADDKNGNPMSAYLREFLAPNSLTVSDVVAGKPASWGVAELPAAAYTAEEQVIEHDPGGNPAVPHPCDPAHVVVVGDKKLKARREGWATQSAWAVMPLASEA